MNPVLKKKLIERGLQNTQPSTWQTTGWQSKRCPNCTKPMYSYWDQKGSHVKCDSCGFAR